MSHFALLDEHNTVVFVTVGRQEDDGQEAEISARTKQVYKQTSYNTYGGVYHDPETGFPSQNQSKAFRKNFAGVGFKYVPSLDAFVPPQPYTSWVLDEETCLWNPPIAKPEAQEGFIYEWDEEQIQWVAVEKPQDL